MSTHAFSPIGVLPSTVATPALRRPRRYVMEYAQDEARRAALGITFTAVLPWITPPANLGRPAVRAYAARSGHPAVDVLLGLEIVGFGANRPCALVSYQTHVIDVRRQRCSRAPGNRSGNSERGTDD
jgi:hypothetical protein